MKSASLKFREVRAGVPMKSKVLPFKYKVRTNMHKLEKEYSAINLQNIYQRKNREQ